MAEWDGRFFEALSSLELAEREDQNAGGQKPLCTEIIGRANRLLDD